ncbi:MAG: hypothetical protein H0X34_14955 [Chthoniobacterales bacterium]|nr:hypothetical protein [Chthoniobacterales bacterium]
MKRFLPCAALFLIALPGHAQIQVDLKFKRLQYIAYEPVIATVTITNLAGRDIDLHDDNDQHWFGFEVTANEGRTLGPLVQVPEPPLQIAAGTSVTRKIDLGKRFPVSDLGVYHVRPNVYFADLNKYFYARAKVFEVTTARPIWQQTVGVPTGGGERTYSLMTNRFADHTSLYARVEDKANGLVYSTYSLGRLISFDEPHAEIDRDNQLHVLQCSAPRLWAYSVVGLDGKLLKHVSYAETRSTPRLRRMADGSVAVAGGMLDVPVVPARNGKAAPKLSDRPADLPAED